MVYSKTILGYLFDSLESANLAVSQCDAYYGYPKSPNDLTRHFIMWFRNDDRYIMNYVSDVVPILGEPIEIKIYDIV